MRRLRLFEAIAIVILAGIELTACSGCASLEMYQVTGLFEKEEPVVKPGSVAVIWTNAVLAKEGSPTTRGFGGLVTFYATDPKKPVRVDGELSVYAYDESSRKESDSMPDRKYVFTPEHLKTHYGEGGVGPSYNIWIPWDEAGGPRREINLILRFDPVEGGPVLAKPTRVVLEGPRNDRRKGEKTDQPRGTSVSRLPSVSEKAEDDLRCDDTAGSTGSRHQMKTTTLTFPHRRSERPKTRGGRESSGSASTG